jgi:ethanolamine permease
MLSKILTKMNGFVRYQDVGSEYFEKRRLQQGVDWLLLSGFGIGVVISSLFAGWSAGLAESGFWGLTIATFLMIVMYLCLMLSATELSTRFPSGGGFYLFVSEAFGPVLGFICGAATLIQYTLLPVVIILTLNDPLTALNPNIPLYVWWILLYTIFVAINMGGVQLTFKVGMILTLLAILILFIFYISVLLTGSFDTRLLVNVPASPGQSAKWLPKGWPGVFRTLPSAIWFYLALGAIPLTSEETYDMKDHLPKALILGMFALLTLPFLTIIFNSGVGGGAVAIATSGTPILDGFRSIFGERIPDILLVAILLMGLLPSFHTIIYAYGRVIFTLSRAGYFPRFLSVTNRYHTPARALILGAVVGLLCAFASQLSESHLVRTVLLNTSIIAALLSYLMVFASYVKLKRESPDLKNTYKSPVGIPGAILGSMLALLTMLACFLNPRYWLGIYGTLIALFVLGLYFLFVSRKQLVMAHDLVPTERLKINRPRIIEKILTNKNMTWQITFVCFFIGLINIFLFFRLTKLDQCPPNCTGKTLSSHNLSGADLAQANFVEADLRKANISEANLRHADLSGAILVRANLEKTDFTDATLIRANLSQANLGGAIFSNTDLRGAILESANLTGVTFYRVKLGGVILSNAKLVNANLSGFNLAGIYFTSADLSGSDLSETNLSGSTLSLVDLGAAILTKSDLSGAWLNRTNLAGAQLNQVELDGASLIGASLVSANLSQSDLGGAILIGADLSGAILDGANLTGARLRASDLREQDLELDSTLANLNKLQRSEIIKDANLSGIRFDHKTIWPEGFTPPSTP